MSKRYYIVPSQRMRLKRRSSDEEDEVTFIGVGTITDLVEYEEPTDSGLVDSHGNAIVSVLERERIGF